MVPTLSAPHGAGRRRARAHFVLGCHARADPLSGLIKHSFGQSLYARMGERSCESDHALISFTRFTPVGARGGEFFECSERMD